MPQTISRANGHLENFQTIRKYLCIYCRYRWLRDDVVDEVGYDVIGDCDPAFQKCNWLLLLFIELAVEYGPN